LPAFKKMSQHHWLMLYERVHCIVFPHIQFYQGVVLFEEYIPSETVTLSEVHSSTEHCTYCTRNVNLCQGFHNNMASGI
jgi:hypothetical protein